MRPFTMTYCRFSRLSLILALLLTGTTSFLKAQSRELPPAEVKLDNLNSFNDPTENWVIAGDVFMDLYTPLDVQEKPGSSVLVNTNKGENRKDIYTSWEHGDIDLELEFMMAKESNSGIYFQGRYELQLLDSWGVENPRFSDLGGIYEWWEDGKGVGGIAPRINASRAPGLWQHLKVKFRAPRFNEQGEKIANARFEEVVLNGEMIHQNVELVHPTGGAISEEEAEKGALRFQGDHGPVAFRNIRYKKYDRAPLRLEDITYKYYDGNFDGTGQISGKAPAATGEVEELSLKVLPSSDRFAVVYEGKIKVEQAGEYFFELRSDGGNRLSIDGETVVESGTDTRWWEPGKGSSVKLTQGIHDVELVYLRGERGGRPALSLMAEGPGIEMHALHTESSFPVSYPNSPKILRPADEPMVMHGFIDMGERVHPHSAAVGYPGGPHYAFDFNSGALLKIWKGTFLNASSMWEGRGGGNLGINQAAAIIMTGAPSLARLQEEHSPWPDSLQPGIGYRFKNYRFEDDGLVTFSYELGDISVEDRIVPADDSRELTRTLRLQGEGSGSGLFVRIAEGESISLLPNGLYQVDDKTYYVELDQGQADQARVREANEGQELIMPVPGGKESTLTYSLVW